MSYMGFQGLKQKLMQQGNVKNPGAVAGSIGRKKYGAAKMAKASSFGKQNPGARPMLAPKPANDNDGDENY